MAPIGRVWLLLALNVATAVIVPLMGLGGGRGATDLLGGWAFALVYTNVTGIPALMAGPTMVERLANRRWPLPAAVVVTTVVFAALGCLAAQALLMWSGIAVPEDFWRQYLHTLSGALLLSVVFGFGVFSYASMR